MLPALLFILLFYTGFHIWWPAMFVMLVPLALLATTPGRKNAWLTAGACIIAWYAVHSFVSTWSGLLCVLLAVVHGGLHALGMLFLRHTARRTRRPLALLLPATWITIEWLRLLPPWGVASGVMAHPLHAQRFLIQSADLGGMHFVSLLVVLTNGLLADLYLRWRAGASREERLLRVTFILSLWAANAVYGAWRIVQRFDHSPESIAIGVIQPDVPGLEHEIAGLFDRKQYITDLLRLSDEALKRAAQKPALIVWPESLATVPVVDDDPAARRPEAQAYIEAASGWATREGIPILAGFSRWDRTGTLRNTSWLFTPGTLEPAPIQDKQHLFPFGESMPIPWEPLREKIAGWTGRSSPWMEPGAERRIFTVPGTGVNAVVAICNEAGFSRSSGIFLPGRDKPFHLLIVQANEGGFHRNAALPLHASLLPFRAIEGRLTIARAANTGISGFVDSTGRVYGTVTNTAGQAWTGIGAPELSLIPELLTGGTASGREDVRAQFSSLQSTAGVTGARTGLVQPDPRRTLFSRTGEWTGPLCSMVSLALLFAPGRKSAAG